MRTTSQVPALIPPRKFRAFIRLTRPIFLLGGVLMYGLGVAIAASQGAAVDIPRALLGQWMVTSIQAMAQYANEYYDFEVDKLIAGNRTFFSGGSGVLQGGDLPPAVALFTARVCAISAVVSIVIVATFQPIAAVIGLIALAGSWYYSAPPLALMGSGWGELSTSIIVALLAPAAGYVLQTDRFDPLLVAISLPLVLIHWAMMIAFEFPDYEADLAVGKKTITVRIGLFRAAFLHNAQVACAAMALIALALTVRPARLVWLALPLAVWQFAAVWRRQRNGWTHYGALTIGAVGLFVLTAILFLVGFAALR